MATKSVSKTKQKISYPHEVRKGSVAIKVYRIEKPSRGTVYVVSYYRGANRQRDSFRNEEKALRHAETTVKALASGKGDSLALGTAELESYWTAKRALASLSNPPALHVAMEEYVSLKKMLGESDRALVSIVDQFKKDQQKERFEKITVTDLVGKFLHDKEKDGLSARYVRDCRERLGRFGRDFQTDIASIKTSALDQWLRSLGQSVRSRKNFRMLIVTLFRYARAQGYLPRDRRVEAEDIAQAKGEKRKMGKIEVFTPDEMTRLLEGAGNDVMPYLALGAFGGIRTAEIMRLTWESIRWDQKMIIIEAEMAKTSARRLVPMADNLAAWLKRVLKSSGPIVKLARPEKTASEVVARSCDPVIPWKRNGLRHSYASYRLAILQDAGKLALEMGNSPTMIFQHYRELVTADDAKAWFEIMPKDKEEEDPKAEKKPHKKLATKVAPDGQPPQA